MTALCFMSAVFSLSACASYAAGKTVSELSDKERYKANVFLGNIVEQRHNDEGPYSFGTDSDIYDLVFFAFKYTDMHSFEDFGMDGSKTTLTLEQVNRVLGRFLGIELTEEQAEKFPQNDHEYYRDGVFCCTVPDGEIFMDIAIVKEINGLEDGTCEMHFDIYSPDVDLYGSGEKDIEELLHLSASEAESVADIYFRAEGRAIALPCKYNGEDTYQLIRIDVDQGTVL